MLRNPKQTVAANKIYFVDLESAQLFFFFWPRTGRGSLHLWWFDVYVFSSISLYFSACMRHSQTSVSHCRPPLCHLCILSLPLLQIDWWDWFEALDQWHTTGWVLYKADRPIHWGLISLLKSALQSQSSHFNPNNISGMWILFPIFSNSSEILKSANWVIALEGDTLALS